MALNIGAFSTTISHDYRGGNAQISLITKPEQGVTYQGTVDIAFILQSYEVTIGSVKMYYSTDGETYQLATNITGDTTNLSVSASGESHTLVWNSLTDLGSNTLSESVTIGITANDAGDGSGNDDQMALSEYFIVDNLPVAPAILDPADGQFQNDLQNNIEFSVPDTDPGSDPLYPYLQADLVSTFNSASLVTKDSSDGTTHARFDHQVTGPTNKPIAGYYVSDVAVSGTTTITFGNQTDQFTNTTVPATITNARVLLVQKSDRRVHITSVSDTQVQLDKASAGGATDGLVDLLILDDATTHFYVVSGIAVTSTSFTTTTFTSLTEDFSQTIPSFGSPPRVLVLDEAERQVIVGSVTTTGIDLKKSTAGTAANGACTLFIFKNSADAYQDTDEAVSSTTLTTVGYESLTDGSALPDYIAGAIPMLNIKLDRHVYLSAITPDDFQVAKSEAGADTNGSVDYTVCTKEIGIGNTFWQPMVSGGIPDTYEGGRARYRPAPGDFAEGIWYLRVAFGNKTP